MRQIVHTARRCVDFVLFISITNYVAAVPEGPFVVLLLTNEALRVTVDTIAKRISELKADAKDDVAAVKKVCVCVDAVIIYGVCTLFFRNETKAFSFSAGKTRFLPCGCI